MNHRKRGKRKMTLYELMSDITIQSNVKVTFENDDFETVVIAKVNGTDDLTDERKLERYEDCEVDYLFVDGDHYLRIELNSNDAQEVYDECHAGESSDLISAVRE
jgi:hypothetical protein